MRAPAFIDGAAVRAAATPARAAAALEASLLAGLDPEATPDRQILETAGGQLLMMPAAAGDHVTVKLVTVGGNPWIQGLAVVFGAADFAPVASIDAIALTKLRTAAVSLLAARHMVRGPVGRLVVFGRGPQGQAHAAALTEELGPATVTMLDSGSTAAEVTDAVRSADLICCATTAREPLFDGSLVSDSASVIAVGSHEPTARELDAGLVGRSAIIVESRRSALREAGDIVMAGIAGPMLNLAELVAGTQLPDDRPWIFKSTGMAWEDAVVADFLLGQMQR